MTILHRCLLCILAVGALATSARVARAADGVVIRLSGPAVPYETVDYALHERRGAVLAEVNKQFAAGFGRQDAVAVLPRDALDTLLKTVADRGAWDLKSVRKKAHQTRWTIELTQGARRRVVVIDDVAQRPDGRHLAVIEAVRSAVAAHTRDLPFHDALLLRSEAGILALRTRPAARVRLDGVLLPRPTPIKALRVRAGLHQIEFLPLDGGPATPYDVRVEAGRATSLNVKLE